MNSVFDAVVHQMSIASDVNGNALSMESIICTDESGARTHHFGEPRAINLRSIAKPIACLAFGGALQKGLIFDGQQISLETLVWPFLSQYTSAADPATRLAWQKVRFRDLLRSTLGHEKGLLFSKDIKDRDPDTFVDYVVNYPITRHVGRDFVYSNAGNFLLSTLVTEFLGVQLDEFVYSHLLEFLGIDEFRWDLYGKYTAGCTGLWMHNEDLHKVGLLLLHDGEASGRQIVPGSFVDEMRSPQVPAPTHRYVPDRAFPKWSYGLNLWICQDGNYYCDGTDGQYLIVLPGRKRVVTVTGFQTDTVPVSDALGLFK